MVIGGVIAITQAQRKVPVQYAQRAVGRKNVFRRHVVHAVAREFFRRHADYFCPIHPDVSADRCVKGWPMWFKPCLSCMIFSGAWRGCWLTVPVLYLVIYALMILFFAYFWVATQFNELQIADDLKKNGGYIPGVRPGQGTSEYLHKSMSRITLAGAIFLMVIATIPIIMSNG